MAQIPKHCIVGFGIAGQLLYLELLRNSISSKDIVIIDENFMGGALMTLYGPVMSNTPWLKTKSALNEYLPWSAESIQWGDSKYQETECMPVRDIATVCFESSFKAAAQSEKITAKVTGIQFEEATQVWKLQHTFGELKSSHLYLCHGATEKQLPLDKPAIPLRIALDFQQLKNTVSAEKDHVTVFGTAHSGTVLLKHLQELGIPTTAIYNTPTPFQFARDGHYDGIKEGSEKIADSILRGEYTNITLLSWNDPLALYKALQKTTKVIYSIGFSVASLGEFQKLPYDTQTAKVQIGPNCYGYGIGFPGVTVLEGKQFTDVSVLSFQDQIRRTLPQSLESARR
jgi:hypothetical protein